MSDLDAFFPSVEVREHPELKDKPVIVGADPKGGAGGELSAVPLRSQEVRRQISHAYFRAWKLCPDGVYLRPHFDLYIPASNSIMEILRNHADRF